MKKSIITALLAVMLLSVAAGSATAEVGYADSMYDAEQAYKYTNIVNRLNSGTDEDWYYWENTTSFTQYATINLLPASSSLNYNVFYLIQLSNGFVPWDSIGTATDYGPGFTDNSGSLTVPAGAKLFVKVYGVSPLDYSFTDYYTLQIY